MILIIKAGTTYPNIRASHGDFEDMVKEKMNLSEDEYLVHSIGDYQSLPPRPSLQRNYHYRLPFNGSKH